MDFDSSQQLKARSCGNPVPQDDYVRQHAENPFHGRDEVLRIADDMDVPDSREHAFHALRESHGAVHDNNCHEPRRVFNPSTVE